jgi:hypothetical protein
LPWMWRLLTVWLPLGDSASKVAAASAWLEQR